MRSKEDIDIVFLAMLSIKDTKGQQLKLVSDYAQAKQVRKKLNEFIASDESIGINKNLSNYCKDSA